MSSAELAEALRSGARVVAHRWAISLVFVTFYLATRPTYIAPGRRDWRALAYSLLTLVCGWWGIPWGPVRTIQTLIHNSTRRRVMAGR